jgi:hypothetical protein
MDCQGEFDLMCQVMMEDSCWLDTYQSAILDGCTKPQKKIEMLEDDTCNNDHESSTAVSESAVAKPLDLEEMPAFEFLQGNKSCVASETFNMVKRFLPSVRKSVAPRQDISFKTMRASTGGRFVSSS